jgi:hypothetical protein
MALAAPAKAALGSHKDPLLPRDPRSSHNPAFEAPPGTTAGRGGHHG